MEYKNYTIKSGHLIYGDKTLKIGNNSNINSGDVFKIGSKYFSKSNVFFDNRINKISLLNKNTLEGIVKVNKNGSVKYGAFSPFKLIDDRTVYCSTCRGSTIIAMNIDLFKNNLYFRRSKADGIFYHIGNNRAENILRGNINFIKSKLDYNSAGMLNDYSKAYNKLNKKEKIDKNILNLSKLLKKYTFGIEFETINGIVNKENLLKLGLIPLRDGSISGLEYATIPLSGSKGLNSMINISDKLKDKTKFDNSCSLHIHIGGVPRTEKFIVAFVRLMILLQDEYFSLFPIVKKYNKGVKRKAYTKPFPSIDLMLSMDKKIGDSNIKRNFSYIYEWLSGYSEAYPGDLSLVKNHPLDRDDNRKWNIKSRYHYINIIPLIFGNKQTIEFRIHPPTYNKDKIFYFLLLNIMILDYASSNYSILLNNLSSLRSLKLLDIYRAYFNNNSNMTGDADNLRMRRYIEQRIYLTDNLFRKGYVSGKESEVEIPLLFRKTPLNISRYEKLKYSKAEPSNPKVSGRNSLKIDNRPGIYHQVENIVDLDTNSVRDILDSNTPEIIEKIKGSSKYGIHETYFTTTASSGGPISNFNKKS